MAVKLYISGKEAFSKRSKPTEEFVMDEDFFAAAEAHSQGLNDVLGDYLAEIEREREAEKARRAVLGRESSKRTSGPE